MDTKWLSSDTLHPTPTSPPLLALPIPSSEEKSAQNSLQLQRIDQRVKFYLESAEITQVFTIKLDIGKHRLSIPEISSNLLVDSLRAVIVSGDDSVIALNVKAIEESDELSDPLKGLAITEPAEASERSAPLDLHSLDLLKLELDRAYDLLAGWIDELRRRPELDLIEWKKGLALLENKIDELSIKLYPKRAHQDPVTEKLVAQISPPLISLQMDLEVDESRRYDIEVSYLVNTAGWEPLYHIRLSDQAFDQVGTKPRYETNLNVEMAARFTQNTGEDWERTAAEFCLFPQQREDFPVLNYPAYQLVSLSSHPPRERTYALRDHLMSPLSRVINLFGDQASVSLTLEIDLSISEPKAEVLAQGKLDTLLPLASGLIHLFVGSEWLGMQAQPPLSLGEKLELSFGEFSQLEIDVTVTDHPPLEKSEQVLRQAEDEKDEEHPPRELKQASGQLMSEGREEIEPEALSSKVDQDDAWLYKPLEQLRVRIQNHDDRVRTFLLSHPLSAGRLINSDRAKSPQKAPMGWVLSADRTRFMRWVSLPPKKSETFNLLRAPLSSDELSALDESIKSST